MSLLSWIWDGIKAKVRYLINSIVDPFKKWVYKKVSELWTAIENAGGTIIKYITNVYKTVEEYITNVYNYLTQHITNIVNNITENITNNITNITKNITNVVGASTAWVREQLADERSWTRNFVKLMDPTGFLKDPIGTIKAAFSIQRKIAETTIIRSFWKGFEEGLEEKEVPP